MTGSKPWAFFMMWCAAMVRACEPRVVRSALTVYGRRLRVPRQRSQRITPGWKPTTLPTDDEPTTQHAPCPTPEDTDLERRRLVLGRYRSRYENPFHPADHFRGRKHAIQCAGSGHASLCGRRAFCQQGRHVWQTAGGRGIRIQCRPGAGGDELQERLQLWL